MTLDFNLFYQYFDFRESRLKDQIYELQTKCLYQNEGKISDEDILKLYTLKTQLQTYRLIERELHTFFND